DAELSGTGRQDRQASSRVDREAIERVGGCLGTGQQPIAVIPAPDRTRARGSRADPRRGRRVAPSLLEPVPAPRPRRSPKSRSRPSATRNKPTRTPPDSSACGWRTRAGISGKRSGKDARGRTLEEANEVPAPYGAPMIASRLIRRYLSTMRARGGCLL